jgi:hypothetical protein
MYTNFGARKAVGLEVNTEKTKYMFLPRHKNAGQNHDIKMDKKCFENVTQFRYLGMNITNQNLIQKEMKRRLNASNVCYHSVQNLFSSRLLSKNIKIITLPVVLYGWKTWSLILTEEHRVRLFEKRVLRIYGPKRKEMTGGWRKLYNEELHNLYSSPSIIRIIKSRRMKWAGNVARMRKKGNAYVILVGKPEGKRPLG